MLAAALLERGTQGLTLQRGTVVAGEGKPGGIFRLGLELLAANTNSFQCAKYPKLCEAPFNCQNFIPGRDILELRAKGMAFRGHANPFSWCMSPKYEDYVHACLVERDLEKAAHTQFESTKAGAFGNRTLDADGSVCFIEGHC